MTNDNNNYTVQQILRLQRLQQYNTTSALAVLKGGTYAAFGGLTYNVLTGGSGSYVGTTGTIGVTGIDGDRIEISITIIC
jgi:hypothetical protein